MKLNPIASNMTEVQMGDGGLYFRVLFSYKTPVACICTDGTPYKTEKKWSATTSRHISKWLDGLKADDRPQEFFDNLIS